MDTENAQHADKTQHYPTPVSPYVALEGKEEAIYATPANIQFIEFEHFQNRANEIAQFINDIELTEENVKEAKHVLANARKVTDGLNKTRIELKKTLLGNFSDFEKQIDSLSLIINTADNALRQKVKDLEEQEREAKREAIKTVWDKRIRAYIFPSVLPNAFERWLTPKHLNKTVSLNYVESDMVAWMEARENDINALRKLGSEYVAEYIDTLDPAKAIAEVEKKKVALKWLEEATKAEEELETKKEKKAIFTITGDKDIKLAELILRQNEIQFELNYI